MTSLSEVYARNEREVTSPERLYGGTALLLTGAALAVLAVLVVTTDLFTFAVSGTYVEREAAGILGGLAVPAVLVGVFTVLPASRRAQAAAAISASLCVLGVALFNHAYPDHWDGHGQDLTFYVAVVYLLGLISAIVCLFVVVVNFKTRNDPGGALEMNVTRRGETKVVEVERDRGLGGVGLMGGTPDGEVETQTNRPDEDGSSRSAGEAASSVASAARSAVSAGADQGGSIVGGAGPRPTSDGGTDAREITSPRAEASTDRTTPAEPADHYCGNCQHFEYRRDSSGMVPFCGHDGERMEDMDACDAWEPNR
ncbi:DUF7139 domain-containing protein [Halovivax limisalsi]|uniref:DUF7139 domain-containing protein n=1 Tax=Halovivax limisalsi TaxID=1453760 RepID=UPI001FFC6723|nr:hypothetical protein [Halovivax limisalsi]